MTWTGHFTVQSASNEEAPGRWDVVLTASADEKVKPYAAHGGDFADTEVDGLSSNTEGKLRSAELHLVFDEEDAPLAVGDMVTVNGHFNRRTSLAGS